MLAERFPGFWPGVMIMEPPPIIPQPHEGLHDEPGGGPHEGVSGEIGAKPGESSPGGGPHEGVSGEIGANPGELPADESTEAGGGVSGSCAALTDSEFERERVNLSLSIYISVPFCFIALCKRYGALYEEEGLLREIKNYFKLKRVSNCCKRTEI